MQNQFTPLPDTPAGRLLAAWLDACAGADKERFRSVSVQMGVDRIKDVDRLVMVSQVTDGFDVVEIEQSEPHGITAIILGRKNQVYSRLRFDVLESDPTQVSFLSSSVLAAWPIPQRLAVPEALAALDSEARLRCDDDLFSGVVLVGQGSEVLFEKAYGMADREVGVSVDVDTKFRIASVGKMFTSVAILQLIEKGLLSLESTVGQLITGYPNRELAEKVTVRHLLNHTSGTGEIFTDEYWGKRSKVCDLADYLALYGDLGPTFEPGSKFTYSNYGYVLLGIIVERVSGTSYYDYLQRHIFAPLEMNSTNLAPESEEIPKRSIGYTKYIDSEWKSTTHFLPLRATSAGGANSTARDLFRFATGLYAGKLIKPETLEKATRVHPPALIFGLGFTVEEEDGVKCVGHSGGMAGMNGVVYMLPDSSFVIAVLANLDPDAAAHLANYVRARLPIHSS